MGNIRTESKIDNVCLAIELSNLGTLYNYISAPGKGLPSPVCRYFALQAIAAINEVHAKGYIHRDIKLENFLLFEEGKTIKLIDFGSCCKNGPQDPNVESSGRA